MQDAFAYCEALVRAADKDRFLTALYAPAEHRAAVLSLYAFNIEIARVREAIRDPLAGEIRLQWWSDALVGGGHGDIDANPVASALRATVTRYSLPRERLLGLIAARRFDLYDEPMATLADLESYGEGASAGLIALVTQVLAADRPSGIDRLVRHAGIAHAITGLLYALPIHATRGQVYLPADILRRHGVEPTELSNRKATPALRTALSDLRDIARRHLATAQRMIGDVPPAAMPALLPVAMARPMLERMEGAGYDPFAPREIPPWRRQWLIWRAARRPARIFG
jgi:15-cis-phytoene synthase